MVGAVTTPAFSFLDVPPPPFFKPPPPPPKLQCLFLYTILSKLNTLLYVRADFAPLTTTTITRTTKPLRTTDDRLVLELFWHRGAIVVAVVAVAVVVVVDVVVVVVAVVVVAVVVVVVIIVVVVLVVVVVVKIVVVVVVVVV